MSDDTTNYFNLYQSGPENSERLPALFYFALSGNQSLNLAPLNEPVLLLKNMPLRVFSISLPYHDEKHTPEEAMYAWGKDLVQGKDPLSNFISGCQKNISKLFEQGLIDPERCAVAGVSRGALAAGKLAALDSHITHILGWAPLVDFSKLTNNENLIPYSLFENLDSLVGKPIKFLIGNHDTRVDTDITIKFIRQLTEASVAKGIRSPQVELALKPSIGYKGHGTAPETFKEGIEWLLKQFKL